MVSTRLSYISVGIIPSFSVPRRRMISFDGGIHVKLNPLRDFFENPETHYSADKYDAEKCQVTQSIL